MMVNKKHFILIYLVLIAIVIGILLASVIVFYVQHKKSDKIQAGVFIKGINVSGLTKEDAKQLVSEKLKAELNDHIILKYKNYEYYVEVEQFEAQFDVDASIEFAYQIR